MEAHQQSSEAETSEEQRASDSIELKRAVRSVRGGGQADLFEATRRTPGESTPRRRVGFIDNDPKEIFIGTARLDDYLRTAGLDGVLGIRDLLRELDWQEFEARYQLTGRSPYAPVAIMGLILYGTMSGISSLRGLEELARVNLGAMWLTGGSCPDHACLGRFINRHGESLTGSFFEQLTRNVLKRLGSKTTQLAGDGTIVEAASSRWQQIKREAAQAAAREAAERAEASPEDDELKRQAEQTRQVADAIEERVKARRRRGGNAGKTQGVKTEPEAAVLKTKNGLFRPSYTPSAMATEDRVIVAQHVEQTSEQAAVAPMLDQAERVAEDLSTVMFDGNYAKGAVLNSAYERDLDILTPPPSPKKTRDKTSADSAQAEKFTKQDFNYDEAIDRYICPNGQLMKPGSWRTDKRRGTRYIEYRAKTKSCRACPLRDRCIGGKTQNYRKVKRYETDELMSALRVVMAQPRARSQLAKRGSWVEPVFSVLKGVQGLNRFRRFGLRGARIEFALHACADYLRRLKAGLVDLWRLLFESLRAILGASGRPRANFPAKLASGG